MDNRKGISKNAEVIVKHTDRYRSCIKNINSMDWRIINDHEEEFTAERHHRKKKHITRLERTDIISENSI